MRLAVLSYVGVTIEQFFLSGTANQTNLADFSKQRLMLLCWTCKMMVWQLQVARVQEPIKRKRVRGICIQRNAEAVAHDQVHMSTTHKQ